MAGCWAVGCSIAACMPAATCRRYCVPEVLQEHYSSSELGTALAAALTRRLTAEPSEQQRTQQQLPVLQQAKVLSCRLPLGQAFVFAGCPAAIAAPSLAPPAGGRSFVSVCRQPQQQGATMHSRAGGDEAAVAAPAAAVSGVLNLCVNARGEVHHAAYLGSQAPPLQLAALVGLPLSYVAAGLGLPTPMAEPCGSTAAAAAAAKGLPVGAVPGAEPGVYLLQQDLAAALCQPWAALLWHDGLCGLRQQLLQRCGGGSSDGGSGSEVLQQEAAGALMQLLQRCGDELPGYRRVATGGEGGGGGRVGAAAAQQAVVSAASS